MYNSRDFKGSVHKPWAAVGAWFLGPKAENGDLFGDLVKSSVDSHIHFRKTYFPCDPSYVTREVKDTESYKKTVEFLRKEVVEMQEQLMKSVPFFSSRYKGHVLWDTVMPANLGYMTSLLYNQNNCAAEASVITTGYEVEVGKDLCVMLGYDEDRSMGHLVTGGSIANIEAMWVARNLKFFPLGLQEAVKKEPKLEAARSYKVFVPEVNKKVRLLKANQWQLLNLDIDTIIQMPEDVQKMAGIEHTELMEIMGKYAYESIGTQKFSNRHKLENTVPCIVAPSTAHVSLYKAATILGIGKDCLVTAAVDEHARMDIHDLQRILENKLESKTPVISVVALMGTTEESAVDSLTDIVNMREFLSNQGLNFMIHGDGAWGGYFASMVREQPKHFYMPVPTDAGFVPEMCLSTHVHKQISAFPLCDTITIDPHKSGFCPYPAGALCYRDKRMNSFLTITSSVLYYHGDVNLGDVGLEGSKPGAAAAGVMLANRVIGLHKHGYGRILGECNFTAKLLYCTWATLAQEGDNFIVALTQPFPSDKPEADYLKYIKENILPKSNEELLKDKEAMAFLKEIGPDTLTPCFSVNIKGNKEESLCNKINDALFKDLCHTNDQMTAHRIPMIVTSSTMEHHKHSKALKMFKERLGLDSSDTTGIKYLVTCCMDPWSTSMEFMDDLGRIMRNAILCAIGTVKDGDHRHHFVSTGAVTEEDKVIVSYAGNFHNKAHQYFTMAQLRFLSDKDADKFRSKAEELQKTSPEPPPLVFRNKEKDKVHDVLIFDFDEGEGGRNKRKETFDIFVGVPSEGGEHFMQDVTMQVVDVPRFDHFDPLATEYPKFSTYFMYGDTQHTFIAHIPTLEPDFQQLYELKERPDGVSRVLLKYGIWIELPEVPGSPIIESEKVVNPLTKRHYEIKFIGEEGKQQESTMHLSRQIWFDGNLADK